MAETTAGDNLKGKILIAMPAMTDPRFHKGVILMLEHGPEGAMGVLINKPLDAVKFKDLLEQLDIPILADNLDQFDVHFGGPVEIGRGFVLHSRDVMLGHSSSLGSIGVTTSLEMLGRIAAGSGPKENLFCLGYAGWSAGQLDQEIKDNAWLMAPLDENLIFHIDLEKRWDGAMALAGIDPGFLSTTGGRA
jgi:putative transcriptional regulator